MWTFEGRPLKNGAIFQVSVQKHTELIISAVSRHHAGTYECRAVTVQGETNVTAYPRLTVFCKSYKIIGHTLYITYLFMHPDRPEVVAGPFNVTACVREKVEFQCNVTGYPKPTVTWLLGGSPITNISISSGVGKRYRQFWLAEGNVLIVPAAKKKYDNGPYSCKVENDYGTSVSNSAYIYIQGIQGIHTHTHTHTHVAWTLHPCTHCQSMCQWPQQRSRPTL